MKHILFEQSIALLRKSQQLLKENKENEAKHCIEVELVQLLQSSDDITAKKAILDAITEYNYGCKTAANSCEKPM